MRTAERKKNKRQKKTCTVYLGEYFLLPLFPFCTSVFDTCRYPFIRRVCIHAKEMNDLWMQKKKNTQEDLLCHFIFISLVNTIGHLLYNS